MADLGYVLRSTGSGLHASRNLDHIGGIAGVGTMKTAQALLWLVHVPALAVSTLT